MPINPSELNLEEFRKVNSPLDRYYISITKNGTLSIFSGFYDKESMEKWNFALLMFDKAKQILGVKFSENDDLGKGRAKVNKNAERHTAWIAAGNLFKYYGLKPAELKGKYTPESHEIA